jgi:hypothetical protein
VGGEYRVLVRKTQWRVSSITLHTYSDFDVQVKARDKRAVPDGPEKSYGVTFRYQDADNFYAFQVNPGSGRYRLLKREAGRETAMVPWTASPHINRGDAPNVVRVVALGPTLRFYVNGNLLHTAVERTFASGRIGLLAWNIDDPQGAEVYFDDFTAYDIPTAAYTPRPTPTSAPTPTPTLTPTPVPTARPTPTPVPLPAGTSKLVYQDDFENPASGWPVVRTRDFQSEYAGGEYRVLVKLQANQYWRAGAPFLGDFHAEVQARYKGGDQAKYYGMVFRFQDDENFYIFLVNPTSGTYILRKRERAAFSTLIGFTSSPSIQKGPVPNLLRVVARGATLQLYVNDTLVGHATDSTFATGRIGLAVWNDVDPDGAEVFFDNLRVFEVR